MKGIADTGFLVAFSNRNDQYHHWAAALAASLTDPLLTCEAVLAETAFHLLNVGLVLAMISDGLIELKFEAAEHLSQLAEIEERFAERKPDFADVCLVRMSEIFPKHQVITVDSDFKFYRRNRREQIPLIFPA